MEKVLFKLVGGDKDFLVLFNFVVIFAVIVVGGKQITFKDKLEIYVTKNKNKREK